MSKINDELSDLFGHDNAKVKSVTPKDSKSKKQGFFKRYIEPRSKFTKILVSSTVIISALSFVHHANQVRQGEKVSGESMIEFAESLTPEEKAAFREGVNAFKEQNQKILSNQTSNKVQENVVSKIKPTYVKDQKVLLAIEDVADFQIPEDLSDKKVVSHVITELTKRADFHKNVQAWHLAATAYREGYSSTFYKDNKGYANGFGQNVSMQSKSSVQERYSSAGIDSETVNFIASLANKPDAQLPSDYKKYKVNPNESAIVSLLHIEKTFKPSVSNRIGGENNYNKLSANQQASLVGLAYQKGDIGSKTGNAVKEFIKFKDKNPNASLGQIQNEWANVSKTYSMWYTIEINGQKVRKHDNRAVDFAIMIAHRPDLAIKQMQGTLTQSLAKEYNDISGKLNTNKKANEKTFTISLLGQVNENDPMKEYFEMAKEGKINISIDSSVDNPKVDNAPAKKGIKDYSYKNKR